MLKDYRNLNIIVILVLNKTKVFNVNDQQIGLRGTMANIQGASNTMSFLKDQENPFLKPGKSSMNKGGFLEQPFG